MIVKLENFLTYFEINGVPQQRGSIRLIEHDENIGMAIIGSDRNLVPAVHFSDWVDGTDTPFATKQDLLDAIVIAAMESNQAGITDAPADNENWVRKNNVWVKEILANEFKSTILPAPISTTSDVPQLALSHLFTPNINPSDFLLSINMNWQSNDDGKLIFFNVYLDGNLFRHLEINAVKKNNPNILTTQLELTGLDNTLHNLELFYSNELGENKLITINGLSLSTKRIR